MSFLPVRRSSASLPDAATSLALGPTQTVNGTLNPDATNVYSFAGAAGEFFTELADALNRKGALPPLVPLKQALSEYEDVIAELRRDRLIVPLNAEDAERVFGAAFALQQLVGNLTDRARGRTGCAPLAGLHSRTRLEIRGIARPRP